MSKTPLGIVLALLVVSAPIYFVRGIGIFDDSLYLKGGQLILDGLKPYQDFYDIKPPGIYYLSAAIAAVGGRGWLAPRIFLFLFAAAFQVALIRWMQRQFGTRSAAIAAVLIGLSYPLCQGYSLHTEPFGAAAAFAASVLILAATPSLRSWGAAGFLLGVATAFKQTGVLYLAAFALFALFEVRRHGGDVKAWALTVAALSGGFLAALAPIALVFAALGLGPAMFDSVVAGVVIRGAGGWASQQSIAVTWLLCPAFIAFIGVVVVFMVSRHARQAMDDRRRQAFVLYAFVGILSILPTLKINLVGHYMQPGAFAFSAACAIFLDVYLRGASVRPARLVAAAAITVMAGYLVAVAGGSLVVLRQNKLRSDLALQAQLRQALDTRLNPNDPVLCVSASSAARLYLMSGRRPFNRSLYFVPTTDWLFSLADARQVLFDGGVSAALVEIDPLSQRPELNDDELASLRSTYEIIPVGPQSGHRLLALIRHDRDALKT